MFKGIRVMRILANLYTDYFTANNSWAAKSLLPDRYYLKRLYKKRLGKELNLKDPKNLTEKIQWLKLYDRRPEYTQMADKAEAKKLIAEKIGEEHIIPTLGVWDHFEDIDFSKLPSQFVLKCTHDTESIIVCTDQKTFDIEAARKKLNGCMRYKMYRKGREWVYKNIRPRIIAEPYIDSLGKKDSVEYKISCFNGKVGFITICKGIAHAGFEDRTNDHFDCRFKRLPFWTYYKPSKTPPQKPEEWDELIKIGERLSENIPYVRVDCYIIDGRIYFGEMTFYTWDGFMKFEPEEYDRILGDMLTLPPKRRR